MNELYNDIRNEACAKPLKPFFPLPLQVYKRAKALDQSDNDISAVYRAYIH